MNVLTIPETKHNAVMRGESCIISEGNHNVCSNTVGCGVSEERGNKANEPFNCIMPFGLVAHTHLFRVDAINSDCVTNYIILMNI